ncbi:MAG: protein-tyrosine phosphatase family protein [Janthinobacterium lividum]
MHQLPAIAAATVLPWARSEGPPPADGVVLPRIAPLRTAQMLMPLSTAERQRTAQLAPQLMPRHAPAPHFDSLVPSTATGPSSGTRYSFTACPMDRPDGAGRRFSTDEFLDHAFRTGTSTTVSLTSRGDFRHSEYYKENKAGGRYAVQSSGRPSFSTMVRDDRGNPVTASIFENRVRNNRTGEVRPMKMVHINGWHDQTALSSDAQMSLISQLKDRLNNHDMRSMAVHCSEGRNRTGCFTTTLESLAAVSGNRPPNTAGHLNWFRQSRVADAVPLPSQLFQLAENEVRMNRIAAAPARGPWGARSPLRH